MKTWLALLTVILTASGAGAQSIPASQSRVAGRFVAYNYGLWNTYPASIIPATGSQTFTVINSFVNLGDGRLISPYSTNAPLRVGTETVTPSAVANCFVNDVRIGVCQITATFTHSHSNSDKISSATFGLQEALNDAGNSGGGVVTVDSAWAGVGGTTAIVNAATLPANTSIEDVRTGTAAGSGTVTGQASGTIPLATAPTVIGAQSHLDDGVTTPATITSTEAIVAPSFSGPRLTITACTTGQVPLGDGTGSCVTPSSGGGTAGATGNGLSLVSAGNGLTTNAAGNPLSNLHLSVIGDSTVQNQVNTVVTYAPLAAAPGQPLYGWLVRSAAGAYTVDSSHNVTVAVSNSDGAFYVGQYATADVGTGTGCIASGSSNMSGPVTAASATTVTIGNATVQASCSGTFTSNDITANLFWSGHTGAPIASINASLVSSVIPAMQAEKALGYSVAIEYRGGINDFRQDTNNFSTAWASLQSAISSVETAPTLAGTPFIYMGPNSLTSVTSATPYICPSGSGTNVNCSATPAAAVTAAGISPGASTVTLTNSPGYTWCPNSLWGGPGAPLEVSSQGHNMQLLLDTIGSGVQETVTVTAITPVSVVDKTHYQCQVSFVAANTHSSGVPAVPTLSWAAQYYTDELWTLQQATIGLSSTYPSVLSLDTQSVIYGRTSPTTAAILMSDQLHPASYVDETLWIGRAIGAYANYPLSVGSRLPLQTNSIGADATGLAPVQIVAPAFDRIFSKSQSSSAAASKGFWRPWEIDSQYSSLSCEDDNLYRTIVLGTNTSAAVAGATILTMSSSFGGTTSIRNGSAVGDIIDVVGMGCISGPLAFISSTNILNGSVNLNGNSLQMVIGAPGLPFAIPKGVSVLIRRERVWSARGYAYIGDPDKYTYLQEATITNGGAQTYTLNTLGRPWTPERSSITIGSILALASEPATAVAVVTAGTGYVTNDTVTDSCGAVFLVTASGGAVTALNLTATGGTRCIGSSNRTPTSTSGVGTGLHYSMAAGLFTIPAGTTCVRGTGGATNSTLVCTDSSGNNYAGWTNLSATVINTTAPDYFGTILSASQFLMLGNSTNSGFYTSLQGCQAGANCAVTTVNGGTMLNSSNAKGLTQGTAVLVAGTVTVSNAAACSVGAACHYQLTNCTAGGTVGTLSVGTISAGVSFIINSSSGADTSTVCWAVQ